MVSYKESIPIALPIFLLALSFLIFEPFLTNLLGATVGTADLDLSNYPDMFVSNGIFNGYLVVGENAGAVEVLTMTEIASNMKIKSIETTTDLSGDAWKFDDKLELANSDTSAGSIQGENLYDVSRYIGKDELGALAEGTYKTRDRSYIYKQFLYFDVDDTATNELVKYAENEDGVTDIFFFVDGGRNIGQYKLELSPSAKSDIHDTTGSASSSGTILQDFEDTKINMFGKDFVLVLARRPQSTGSVKLTLMSGAVRGSLLESQTQTYQLNGDSYDIGLTYVDSTHAKFLVNGESTNKLQVGDTYKLANGKEIGVSETSYQDYSGGIHSANFFVGANKLVLRDDDITDSESDSELVIGGETIDGADVVITGTDDNTVFALSTIVISMTAQNDYYVGEDDKLSSVIESAGDDPRILFINNWDIEFKGLSGAKSHEIKLDPSGSRKYDLVFYDGKGDKVKLPLFYAVDDNTISFGEEATEKCLNLNEGVAIRRGDYFVLTGGSASSGSAVSFALQYKGADSSTETSPKIKFKNLGNGKTLEYTIDTSSTEVGSAVTDIKLGGYTFPVINDEVETSANFNIRVSLDGGSTVGADNVNIVDEYGAQIAFSNIPGAGDCRDTSVASSAITITTEDSSDYGNQVPAEIVITVGATASNQVNVNSFTVGGTSNPLVGDGGITHGYTSMGGKITYTSSSGSPNSFTYDYPKKQKLPLLYVTSEATTPSPSVGREKVTVILADAAKLDSEITDVTAQNLIVIGGACVNTVAAKLLGNPVDCFEGFTPGKARIKLLKNGENVAMLVAGYTSTETKLAGKVIAYRWTDLSGSEVEVEGTTYSDAIIQPISAD